jgi:hypothetical protein
MGGPQILGGGKSPCFRKRAQFMAQGAGVFKNQRTSSGVIQHRSTAEWFVQKTWEAGFKTSLNESTPFPTTRKTKVTLELGTDLKPPARQRIIVFFILRI